MKGEIPEGPNWQMLSQVYRRPLEASMIAVWAGYFSLMAIWGFQSTYDSFWLALSYQVLFVAILLAVYTLVPKIGVKPHQRRRTSPLIIIGLSISAAAIVALFIAKQDAGVDYAVGLCQARYQMSRIGRIGSPLSMVGNLFSYAFFVPVAAVIVRNVNRSMFWTTIGLSFGCLMALSIVTASRSTLMIFGAFCLACLCVRMVLGRRIPRITLADIACVVSIVAVVAMFVLNVFACRAEATNLTSEQYQERFTEYMGMSAAGSTPTKKGSTDPTPTNSVEGVSPPAASADGSPEVDDELKDQAGDFIGMAVLYIVHSAYTFDGILSSVEDGNGQVLLRYTKILLSRVGLVEPPQNWALAGRFTSLPGALYHDFGATGLLAGAVVFGLLAWAAVFAVRAFAGSVIVIGGAAMLFTILLLSPIHPAQEFMAFPFICVMFLLVPILAYPFTKPRRHNTPS